VKTKPFFGSVQKEGRIRKRKEKSGEGQGRRAAVKQWAFTNST